MKAIPNDVFFHWVESEIKEGRAVHFRLKGDSMFPLLRNNKDEVILQSCSHDDLRPMDVLLFRYRDKYLLHRLIRRDGDKLLLQGDGSYVAQEECTTADVIGKVVSVVKSSGKVIAVDSWQWRWPSYLWPKAGCCRTLLLRALHVLMS